MSERMHMVFVSDSVWVRGFFRYVQGPRVSCFDERLFSGVPVLVQLLCDVCSARPLACTYVDEGLCAIPPAIEPWKLLSPSARHEPPYALASPRAAFHVDLALNVIAIFLVPTTLMTTTRVWPLGSMVNLPVQAPCLVAW